MTTETRAAIERVCEAIESVGWPDAMFPDLESKLATVRAFLAAEGDGWRTLAQEKPKNGARVSIPIAFGFYNSDADIPYAYWYATEPGWRIAAFPNDLWRPLPPQETRGQG